MAIQRNYSNALQFLEDAKFNGVALIKKGEKIILRDAFGKAGVDKLQPNTIDTQFHIGSLTKSFTALAVVQLKREGRIQSYDDPVSKYLNKSDFSRGDKVTVRNLLNHTSGIPDYTETSGSKINPAHRYTAADLVSLFNKKWLKFKPGSRFEYSNSNYVLLGYLIEVITGQSYFSYLRDSVLKPLGMNDTEYLDAGYQPAAVGLDNNLRPAFPLDMSIPYAAGGLSSTLFDMELWADCFLNSPCTLMSSEDRKEIFKPVSGSGDYGFGWITQELNKVKIHYHVGQVNGFSSVVALYPEAKGMIIFLSNQDGQGDKLFKMATAIAEREF